MVQKAKGTLTKAWNAPSSDSSGGFEFDNPHFLDRVINPVGDNDVVEASDVVNPTRDGGFRGNPAR